MQFLNSPSFNPVDYAILVLLNNKYYVTVKEELTQSVVTEWHKIFTFH